MTNDSLLVRNLDPASLRPDARLTIEATAEERANIAAFLDLLELEALVAQLTAECNSKGAVRVRGKLSASLTQRCVVTLEPVPASVDVDIDLRFAPEGDRSTRETEVVSVDREDPPEPYPPTGIDLGAALLEQLALNLDPYPRAPGVEFESEPIESDEADSPFAVLKSLGHRNA